MKNKGFDKIFGKALNQEQKFDSSAASWQKLEGSLMAQNKEAKKSSFSWLWFALAVFLLLSIGGLSTILLSTKTQLEEGLVINEVKTEKEELLIEQIQNKPKETKPNDQVQNKPKETKPNDQVQVTPDRFIPPTKGKLPNLAKTPNEGKSPLVLIDPNLKDRKKEKLKELKDSGRYEIGESGAVVEKEVEVEQPISTEEYLANTRQNVIQIAAVIRYGMAERAASLKKDKDERSEDEGGIKLNKDDMNKTTFLLGGQLAYQPSPMMFHSENDLHPEYSLSIGMEASAIFKKKWELFTTVELSKTEHEVSALIESDRYGIAEIPYPPIMAPALQLTTIELDWVTVRGHLGTNYHFGNMKSWHPFVGAALCWELPIQQKLHYTYKNLVDNNTLIRFNQRPEDFGANANATFYVNALELQAGASARLNPSTQLKLQAAYLYQFGNAQSYGFIKTPIRFSAGLSYSWNRKSARKKFELSLTKEVPKEF